MKKLIFIIIIFCWAYNAIVAQQSILQEKISIKLEDISMAEAISEIANKVGMNVSYSSELLEGCEKVSVNIEDQMMITLLNQLLSPCNVSYTVHAGQLILLPKQTNKVEEYTIRGTIFNEKTGEPIAFATLQLENKPKGVVADNEGFFEIKFNEIELASNNIVVSSIGFEKKIMEPDSLINKPEIIILLKERTVLLDDVTVSTIRPTKKEKKWGNTSRWNKGSLYLDTHGQQIALFVDNKKEEKGYIKNVSYFLSKDGNVEAPFRVRIMEVDTLNNDAPGKDLISDILVVQPPEDSDGWYDVDLTEYNIKIPEEGFFLGLQGIYPNDFSSFENNSELVDKLPTPPKKQYIPRSIHYGQGIGHSGKKGVETWHYSLSHEWFQMEKNNYNVKITTLVGLY